MQYSSVIRAVAHYVPSKRVTNDDLTKLMDTSDAWIQERTGIKERRFIEKPGTSATDIGEIAAKAALEKAGWKPGDVDAIVAGTISPDMFFPGIGVLLQNRLGCPNIPALDIRVACSAFVYGMSVVDGMIKSKQAKRVLFVCSEVQSPVLDLTTKGRDTAVLFGDGAGALAIEAVETSEWPTSKNGLRGIMDSLLGSDGGGAEVLCMPAPGTKTPGFIRHEDIDEGRCRPKMDGRVVFKNAVTRLIEVSKTICARNQLSPTDISLVLPHQANLRINEMVRTELGLPTEKVWNNIERYGNTTAATIPICMSEAVTAGKLKENDLVLTIAFGAGFTWGANLIRW